MAALSIARAGIAAVTDKFLFSRGGKTCSLAEATPVIPQGYYTATITGDGTHMSMKPTVRLVHTGPPTNGRLDENN